MPQICPGSTLTDPYFSLRCFTRLGTAAGLLHLRGHGEKGMEHVGTVQYRASKLLPDESAPDRELPGRAQLRMKILQAADPMFRAHRIRQDLSGC